MTPEPSELVRLLSLIVGPENVFSAPNYLSAYERTTFNTENRVRLVVEPASTEEVQQLLKEASTLGVTVYPVSRGCNWGLGSRVPLSDQSVVIDLSRMNRIVNFNAHQAFMEIEPGVTFNQACHFLRDRNSDLFLSVIGGHPDSSIIGNTLERGDGLGPLGDRSHFVCSLEVVLADGSILKTGLGNFTESYLRNCTRDPIGPALDGLFCQSNLGIVTGMTIWLKKQAQEFASGMITFSSLDQLEQALPMLRRLQEQGVLQGNCMAIWNIHKILAASGQHPLQQQTRPGERAACLTEHNLAQILPKGLKNVRWLVTLALYAPTPGHMKLNCRLVRCLLKPYARRIFIMTRRLAWIGRLLSTPASKLLHLDLTRWLDAFYFRSVYQGHPSDLSIRSLYWRKPGDIPSTIDPDADRCGLLWLCHLVPHTPEGFHEANRICSEHAEAQGFEPNLAFLNTSERACRMFVALMYDRNVTGEDERALACQNSMQQALASAGFPAFRLGLQSMKTVTPNNPVYSATIHKLKALFDPAGVISPGHYDFGYTAHD